MTCLSTIKFNLVATVTRDYKQSVTEEFNPGTFQDVYDELTGEVRSVWVAADLTPTDDDSSVITDIPCSVAPSYTVSQANDIRYQNGGARILDTERLVMKIPSKYHVYTTDKITAIRNRTGDLIFENDQLPKKGSVIPAIYNITGVTPVMDPFGRVIERQVQLEKYNS